MVFPVVLACAFLMIQTVVIESVNDKGLQQDVEEIIEAELGKSATLRFNDTFFSNDLFLSNWIIWGPYRTTIYKNSSHEFSARESNDIEKCIAESDWSLLVTSSKFGRRHTGKWKVGKEYRGLGNHQNITHKNISFSVQGIEFEKKYHGKSFDIKEGEYVVMNFDEGYLKYSVCNLVKMEPNTVYDLNAELYRSPKGHEGIKRLDPCGFRMHVGNTSDGNWSLVGRFGYIQKRAYFGIVIDSSTSRPPKKLTMPIQSGWTGFPIKFKLKIDSSQTYWELERPDGYILQPRNMSSKYMKLISITSDDNGTWIARAALNSDLYLTEQKIIIQISEFPQISSVLSQIYDMGEFQMKEYTMHVDIDYDIELCEMIYGECRELQKIDTTSVNCDISRNKECFPDCTTTCTKRQSFLIRFESILSLYRKRSDSIRLIYGTSTIDFFMEDNEEDFFKSQIQSWSAWHFDQEKKYVTRGKSFEVKCSFSTQVKGCSLFSPEKKLYTLGNDSFITSKNCHNKIGICSCIAVVENATTMDTGSWYWIMVLENEHEAFSKVPIEVLESPLISEIIPLSNLFWDVLLICRTPPIMYYEKVRYCEWLRPDGVRLSENNSMQYIETERDNNCTLALLGSSEENSGEWKCIARIDGYPKDEMYATLNVSKELIEDIKHRPKNASWPSLDFKWRQILEDDGTLRQRLIIYIRVYNESRLCTIKDQDGQLFDASRMIDHDYSRWYFYLNIMEVSEEVVTRKLEILLDNEDDISASMMVTVEDPLLAGKKDLRYFWHTVPKKVVLKCGCKFEEKYRANERLQSCTLESPNGVKYNDSKSHSNEDDVQVGKDEEGFSCLIIIMPQYLTKEHSGNWFLEMKTESGLESRDPLPIQVIKSYIVLEAERGMYLNGNIKLHCRRRSIMYDVKIRNCKWFRPGVGQIFTNESMKYSTTEEYDVCTLELSDPGKDDFGTWECSAGVDGYSDEEIAILDLSPTFITPNKHYEKREIVMDNESKMEYTKLHMMVGDAVELICTASILNFQDRIEWRYNDSVEIIQSGRIKINKLPETTTHYRSMLSINRTLKSDNKTVICSAMLRENHGDTSNVSTSYAIEFDRFAPFFVDTNMNKTKWKYNFNITNPETIILKCYADGSPEPEIVWKRNGIEINDNSQPLTEFCNATFSNQSQELHIYAVNVKCSGIYLCQVQNHLGEEKIHQTIEIGQQNNSTINTPIERSSEYPNSITIFIVFIFILICLSIMACYCLSERMRLKRKMIEVETALGLNETRLGPLNPEGMLHEQADFLPYDEKRWEYPEENLEMEEQLGHGFFGIVMKAKASNIIGNEGTHIVAVKKLEQSDVLCSAGLRALEIELRILANLEKHSNVVNLLGACTKKAAIGYLMVILEYCALGNLLNYLRENSSAFIDQIDPSSGTIDFSKKKSFAIGSEIEIGSGPGTLRESSISEDAVGMSTQLDSNTRNDPSNGIGPRERKIDSEYSDSADISYRPIRSTINTNLYTPAFWGNVADDNDKFISIHHLLTWAFQTACAMEYLSAKKILHGDLAARNILLTEQRVAKICDFGLARTIPEGYYYRNMDTVMPIKWMAIESIEKRKYSTQSDVWSFGIFLWETFTLGKRPYAELNPNELIAFLCNGQRLEMPIYATEGIYKMMLRCWNEVPEDRPSFRELVQDIGKILNESQKA